MLESLKRISKQIFVGDGTIDHIIEGVYADQYPDELKQQIREQYLNRWHPDRQIKTPLTHPELFDPCEPPQGWCYDPYYELWIQFKS